MQSHVRVGIGGKTRTTIRRKSYKRDVPVEPKLHDLLLECFGHAAAGQELVGDVTANNLRRDFVAIRKRPGLPFSPKPFYTLRKNRETEWASTDPSTLWPSGSGTTCRSWRSITGM